MLKELVADAQSPNFDWCFPGFNRTENATPNGLGIVWCQIQPMDWEDELIVGRTEPWFSCAGSVNLKTAPRG